MDDAAGLPQATDADWQRSSYDAVVAEAAPDVTYPSLSIASLLNAQYGRQPPPWEKLRLYDLSDSGRHGLDQLMDQFHHVIMTRATQLVTYRGGYAIDERDLAMAVMTCPDVMPRAFVDAPSRPALEPHRPASRV